MNTSISVFRRCGPKDKISAAVRSAFWLLMIPAALLCQEFRATLTGRVTDPSGSPVPGASVQVRNSQTNEISTGPTDAQGNYTAPLLRPGLYSVAVEAPGFKKFTRENITLNVGQSATVNVSLELGPVTDAITVTAEAALLETSKSDRGSVIDNQQVREFPLNARNPFMLSLLVAGVNFNGNAIYQRPFDNGAIAEWTINGSQSRSNEFLLDGAPNNSQAGGNNIALVPSVDAVQEFKIQTNSYDSQYGHTGGGIINVSLKSGTNALHGSLYEFARRSPLDANSFQNNARGVPRNDQNGHYLDQYGFSVSGPIVLPKLYNGRDKSFFMVSYEGYREGTPTPLTLSVPEPEMLQGDFSKLVDSKGQKITIYDPTTGRDVNGVWTRDPFPGNKIPAERINPIARRILAYQPKPNTSTPGQGYSSSNLFIPEVDRDDFYNLGIKLDQNMGERNRVFFRHASNDRTEMRHTNGVKGIGEDGPLPLKRVNDAYVIDWVGTVNPTLIANARISFSRYLDPSFGRGNSPFDLTSLGFPASLAKQLPVQSFFGRYEFSGYNTLGRYFGGSWTNTWAAHPTITKIAGSHSMKGGVDLRWIQYLSKSVGNAFRLTADRSFTQKQYNRGDSLSGNSIATFLLGTPTGGNIDYNSFQTYLYRYFAPYFQDDWKVTRRLTLNLGLRWDFNISANERFNRLNRSFAANVVNPVDKLIDRNKFPNLPQLRGGLLFAGVNGVPRTATDLDKWNLQPRIGGAFQVSNKLVVRGGWGRYFINPNNDYLQANGFSQSTPYISNLDGGKTPIPNLIDNPFPGGVLIPPGNSLGLLTYLGRGSFNFVNPSFKIPHVDQFSFGFQYQLPLQSKIEVSYVGSRTRNLETDRAFNEQPLSMRQSCNLAEGGEPLHCDERVPSPFFGLAPFRGTSFFTDPTLSQWDLSRPYPEFGGLTGKTRNDGAIFYNSMQVTYEVRAASGLNMIATYTLSKQIERWGFNDSQRGVMQEGLYPWDRPQRFTVGSVYQLPIGKGKRFLNNSNPILSRIFSGWENNWVFQWQSGAPWRLPRDNDHNVLYVKEAKIEHIDWSAPQVYGVKPCVAKWNDNGSITLQPYSVTYGCTDYNFLIMPRYAPYVGPRRDGRLRLHNVPQADVSFNKNTRVTEKTSIQLRAEAFNVFNTFMFHQQNFNNDPENSNFGTIIKATVGQGSANFPRQIQLAVKLIW